MNAKQNSFICPMAWMATGVCAPGYIRLCCNSDGSAYVREDEGDIAKFLNQSSVNDYYNNEYMKKIRTEMISGQVPLPCQRCKVIEDTGNYYIAVDIKMCKDAANEVLSDVLSLLDED